MVLSHKVLGSNANSSTNGAHFPKPVATGKGKERLRTGVCRTLGLENTFPENKI